MTKEKNQDVDVARLTKELAESNKLVDELRSRENDYHQSSMDLALVISECFQVLSEVRGGNLNARISDAALESGDELLRNFSRELNATFEEISTRTVRIDEYHAASMDMAMGLSECFQVMSEVRQGNLDARVSDLTMESPNELIANLGRTLNDTVKDIKSQVEVIKRQTFAIQELSTPVLQLWNDVLALPVIGTVDTRRAADIMERLLSEIVMRKSKFVILDITGVEIVDTKTADHFVKLIKAASLLGTQCLLTGIQPAVAQTLVEIGVDLSMITTLRDLQAGLHYCLQEMGKRKSQEQHVK